MTVDDDCDTGIGPAGPEGPFALDRAVASLYADLRLTPMLHALLARTRELVDGVAGSVSVIDADAGTYRKVAERGIACQVGRTFSLDEGATGRAVLRGCPVVIDEYSAITGRHLPPEHPANRGSVVAVPIWWLGELIGVNVAFVGRHQHLTTREVDRLEILTQTAAGAIVTAGAGDPALAGLRAGRGGREPAAPSGPADAAAPPAVLLAANPAASTPPAMTPPMSPHEVPAAVERRTAAAGSPLTARETEVLALVALGLGDREIARRLVLSPKTVEKHVGSAIRKTGSTSRTGAAVLGLERGWILP